MKFFCKLVLSSLFVSFLSSCASVYNFSHEGPSAEIGTDANHVYDGVMLSIFEDYKHCKGEKLLFAFQDRIKGGRFTKIPAGEPVTIGMARNYGQYVGNLAFTFIPKENERYLVKAPVLSKDSNSAKVSLRVYQVKYYPVPTYKRVPIIKRNVTPTLTSVSCEVGNMPYYLNKLK